MINRIHFLSQLTIFVFLSYTFVGCNTHETNNPQMAHSIAVQQDKFVDNYGRHVILNGINVISKSKDEGYITPHDSTLYTQLSNWGFNAIRFGIIWDGIEPEPGVYNETYLQAIDQHIQWASDNNIFVILDMHQDLYSSLYADGAPQWATLHQDKPHTTGDVWSDSYMQSEAVQTAFDNFWANAPASDGIGLQDHYAQMWQHIAKRYANNPTVIGYDLMNEPFPGSAAQQLMPTLLTAYGQMIYESTGEALTPAQLEQTWANVDERTEALKNLSTQDKFASVVDALYPFNNHFEVNQLQPFYQKVSDAIRQVDPNTILFLEHSYLSNMGIKSSIQRTHLPDGSPDTQVAYAPHGYDLVTDTDDASASSFERLDFIFNRIQAKGQELNMPVWLGEWGAFYHHGQEIVPVAQHAISAIEAHLFGQAYWSYGSHLHNIPYFNQAILRPYPAYTNGELLNYKFDRAIQTLSITWQEEPNYSSPTQVYIPNLAQIGTIEALKDTFNASTHIIPNSDAGWIVIPPLKNGQRRQLEIEFKN